MVTLSAPRDVSPSQPSAGVDAFWRRRALTGLSVGALVLLIGSLALRLVLWWRAEGFEQGDPVEYINIAYKLAFGIGIEWWDLRPLLLSLIYVPVLYVAQWWPDPTGEAMVKALRLVGVLFATGMTLLVYLIGRRLGGELVGLGAGLLVAVNPVANRLAVSTFAEVPSTCFVLLCLWLLLKGGRWPGFGAGLALGVACMIRYQAIFFLPAIGTWVVGMALYRSERGPGTRLRGLVGRRALPVWFGAGLVVAALAQGIVEMIAYGQPYHSLIVSFEYNVTSGLAPVEFGAEPFDWFLRETPDWFGVVPALLALVGTVPIVRGPNAAGWRLVGLTAAVMFLALSALPHKEDRFMAQLVPLLALFAAQGAVEIGAVAGARVHRVGTALAAGLLLIAALPLLLASWSLSLKTNVAYVDGPKRAAEIKPGGVMGTIPWFVPRPYSGTRLTLERMDRNVWKDRALVARTIEESDFLLFPEYWLLEDREIDRLVDARFRSIQSYDNGVVLYASRRLEDPGRRRSRP